MNYEMFTYFVNGAMVLFGLIMAVAPKTCTKKDFREDNQIVEKTRKSGIGMIICGIALLLIHFITFNI
ncbi:MAG: hypothetical protein IIY49_11665 [Eubacterium sp.]|nr:hypothetical protein [Eubacterium sp.]